MSVTNREVLLDDLKAILSQHVAGFDAEFARCASIEEALSFVGEQVINNTI